MALIKVSMRWLFSLLVFVQLLFGFGCKQGVASSVGQEKILSQAALQTGTWGTCPWEFDLETGQLMIGAGSAATYVDAPWENGQLDRKRVKTLIMTGPILAPENATYLFNFPGLEAIDGLAFFNTKGVTNMKGLFSGCRQLVSLDLSTFETTNVTDMTNLFSQCVSLVELNLSSFSTEKVERMGRMFTGVTLLNRLTLGEQFKFQSDASLPTPQVDKGTGKWIRADGQSKAYSANDFMTNYGKLEDLTAGTYVPEIKPNNSTLAITAPSVSPVTIGESLTTSFEIKHTATSENGSEASSLSLSGLDSLSLLGSQTLTKISIETYNKYNQRIKTEDRAVSDTLSLSNLPKDNYYKIIVSGQAVNNTDASSKTNYQVNLSYRPSPSATPVNLTLAQKLQINSGALKFAQVPAELGFESTPFSLDLKDQLIKRRVKDWTIKVADQRGTTPQGNSKQVDRTNWTLLATATPFSEDTGAQLPQGALVVTSAAGKKQEDLSDHETKLVTHDVSGESPLSHPLTQVRWAEDEGLLAVVRQRQLLRSGHAYQATLTFELRVSPS